MCFLQRMERYKRMRGELVENSDPVNLLWRNELRAKVSLIDQSSFLIVEFTGAKKWADHVGP